MLKVVNDSFRNLKNHKLCEAALQSPVQQSLFTYSSSQVIDLRWLLVWVHVIQILKIAYVKVNYYIRRNRCKRYGYKILYIHALAIREIKTSWSPPSIFCSAFPILICFCTYYQFEMASCLSTCAVNSAKDSGES